MLMSCLGRQIVICILSFSSFIVVKGFVGPSGAEQNQFANVQDRFNDFFTEGSTPTPASSIPPPSPSPPPPPLPSFLSFNPFNLPFKDQDFEAQQQPGEFDKFVSSPMSLENNPTYGNSLPEKQQQSILLNDEQIKEKVIKLLGP